MDSEGRREYTSPRLISPGTKIARRGMIFVLPWRRQYILGEVVNAKADDRNGPRCSPLCWSWLL